MSAKNRTVKIWASLVASMTIGAIVLMALDNQKIAAPAFSLSSFQKLENIDRIIENAIKAEKAPYNCVDIDYSNTIGGTIDNIALSMGTTNPAKADFHFLIGNGDGAPDGEILITQRWESQQLCNDNSGKIKILVVSDGFSVRPTETQVKRLASLLNTIARKYKIKSSNISQPANLEL